MIDLAPNGILIDTKSIGMNLRAISLEEFPFLQKYSDRFRRTFSPVQKAQPWPADGLSHEFYPLDTEKYFPNLIKST